MNREEHLEWCKTRALEYINNDNIIDAWNLMVSDLRKHKETENHSRIMLGITMITAGYLSTIKEMKKFIEGFN